MLAKDKKRTVAMRKNSPANIPNLSRRAFVIGLPLFAAGCVSTDYGSRSDGGHTIAAVDTTLVDPKLMRAEVPWTGKEKPGTVVVNIKQRQLFVVESGGRAIRYGIGVGRSQGANFRGTGVVGRKEKWPYWTPTGNMMAAIPEYRAFARGLPGGEENPLGPRALYLYRDGKDTMFRLHGTIEPETIGQAVSSGCIRLFNQDIIDLYDRVPVGAQVVVRS
jgi:lipoprotein-anchoring transpeptidase ErfK/SrfK